MVGEKITLVKPVDTHIHLRQEPPFRLWAWLFAWLWPQLSLANLVRHLKNQWAAILPMPNTKPPITTGKEAVAYAGELRRAGFRGKIIMTIKLTKETTPDIVRQAVELGVRAAKFYPRGLTTNSEDGFGREDFGWLDRLYLVMEACGMHLLMHGEMPGETNLNREIVFLAEVERIAKKFPRLKITLEHITTKQAVRMIGDLYQKYGNVTATITAHHLRTTLDTLLDGGLHQHDGYCKPVAKEPSDQQALIGAALSGHPAFRFGSDSAPHLKGDKEKDCGCAGVYTAPIGIPLMVDFFSRHMKMDRWEGFMFRYGNDWFDLGLEPEMISVEKKTWTVPAEYDGVVPFMAGRSLDWQIVE